MTFDVFQYHFGRISGPGLPEVGKDGLTLWRKSEVIEILFVSKIQPDPVKGSGFKQRKLKNGFCYLVQHILECKFKSTGANATKVFEETLNRWDIASLEFTVREKMLWP